MPIGNFQQRLSDDDRNSLNLRNNPPDTDPDFSGGTGNDIDWGAISEGLDSFDDSQDPFASGQDSFQSDSDPFQSGGNNGGFGDNSFGNNSFGNNGFGNNSFGNNSFGNNGFGSQNPFGNPFTNNQQQVQQTPDKMDKLMEGGVEVGKQAWQIFKQAIAQIKHRTFDDLGYYSRNLIITGGAIALVGFLLFIVQAISGAEFIQNSGIVLTSVISGILVAGTGLIQIGQAAIALAQTEDVPMGIDQIPDIQATDSEDNTNDYEESLGDELDDLFGSDNEDDLDFADEDTDEFNSQSDQFDTSKYQWGDDEPDNYTSEPKQVDVQTALDNIQPNQVLTRHNLIETMLPFFPLNRPDFSDLQDIPQGSNEFDDLELITVKAIANVMQKEIEEVQTKLLDAQQGIFSYRLRFKRINQLNSDSKREALADEFVNYMRQNPNDKSVQATVELDGDYFVVTVQKGEQAVVTIGDILQKSENKQFFEDEGNKLPMIVGIDDLGNVIMDDAKKFDTCMIMGKPRSGKSWYVFNMLINMMAFNNPEDVQFIIVDPKQANLFYKLAYMPHVIGLHNDKEVLEIMDDIIENEGERRKKLLKNNECDDIWGLRRKGIRLPILYLVIDEVITVMGNLRAQDPKKEKEFNQKLKILISELPFVGIRLIFIPHRATGLVDKTNRAMLQFIAAVRSARDEIEEGLGVTKWYRGLTKPGDMAIKMQTREDAFYARGPAIATQDEQTAEVIIALAKAYYKLGVKPSELSKTLTKAFNRDERYVKEKLSVNGIIQYDANKVLTDDDLDMYDEPYQKGPVNREAPYKAPDIKPIKHTTFVEQADEDFNLPQESFQSLDSEDEYIDFQDVPKESNQSNEAEDDDTWVGHSDNGEVFDIFNEVPDDDDQIDIGSV